ncbi:MAG: MATE family efflux transporter, partial [Candidatus Binataceae bacterium]
MGHSVVIAVAFGAVFTAAILGAGEALFSALGGRGEVLANALRYSSLVFGAAVPIWIVNLLAAALRGAGNVRIPAILTAVGAAMTLCLSPLLIFGWGPFPRFGVAGAGLAMIVIKRHPEIVRGRLIVDNVDGGDRMTLHVEVPAHQSSRAEAIV